MKVIKSNKVIKAGLIENEDLQWEAALIFANGNEYEAERILDRIHIYNNDSRAKEYAIEDMDILDTFTAEGLRNYVDYDALFYDLDAGGDIESYPIQNANFLAVYYPEY